MIPEMITNGITVLLFWWGELDNPLTGITATELWLMTLALIVGLLLSAILVSRTKSREYSVCVFTVFLASLAPFMYLHVYAGRTCPGAETAGTNIGYPFIVSAKHIRETADDWSLHLRFLDCKLLEWVAREIILGPVHPFIFLFTSNLLAGTIGFVAGVKIRAKSLTS